MPPSGVAAHYCVDVSNATTPEPYGEHSNQNLFDYWAEQVATALHLYYTPILVLLGTLGNSLSVYVFHASKLRTQSTSQYLTALALSDTLFLMQLLAPWLNALQLTGVFHHEGFCQVFVYVSYVCSCLSAWLVVAFTVERFVAVLYPLQRIAVCTVKRARLAITAVTIAALLLNLPVLRFATPAGKDCNIDYEYIDQAAKFNLVDTAMSFTLPLVVIIVLNTWIVVGVCHLERKRMILMKTQGHPPVRFRSRPLPLTACPRFQHRVTSMLLLVSSVFVVLNLPAYTMRIVAYAYDISLSDHSGRWAALQQITMTFFNTNFGINFLLYCLSGQNFRRHLQQTLPCLPESTYRAADAQRIDTFPPANASSISTSFVSAATEATVTGGTPCLHRRRARPDTARARRSFDNNRQPQYELCSSLPPAFGLRGGMDRWRRARDVAVQTPRFTTVF